MTLTALCTVLDHCEREIVGDAVGNATLDSRRAAVVFVPDYPSVGVVHITSGVLPCSWKTGRDRRYRARCPMKTASEDAR